MHIRKILGLDEVGRGPWAGPLVVGAVVLSGGHIDGLTDSKKLTPKRRKELSVEIYKSEASVGMGWVTAAEIDEAGLSKALRLATKRAVKEINTPFHEIIIDGTINLLASTRLEHHVTTLKKADLLIPEVSAASIVAKVARDEYMQSLAEKYPQHGFESHVGYGTAAHLAAIKKYGLTPEHRKSFRPIADLSPDQHPKEKHTSSSTTTTKQIGNRAEDEVSSWLEQREHAIVARNWKTKFCEIDIISRDENHIYFTEVKYRRTQQRGSGLEAITHDKKRQMQFAAESYMKWTKPNLSPILAAASVSGPDYHLDEWLTITEVI